MSDSFISLVPTALEVADPEKKAENLKTFLWNAGIIQTTPSDCTLSDDLGYRPGANYEDALTDRDIYNQVPGLAFNGVNIVTIRHVFHNGGNGLAEVICPTCLFNAIEGPWINGTADYFKK